MSSELPIWFDTHCVRQYLVNSFLADTVNATFYNIVPISTGLAYDKMAYILTLYMWTYTEAYMK